MRPARKGPENPSAPVSRMGRRGGFNEAGPQGAGKPHDVWGKVAVIAYTLQ